MPVDPGPYRLDGTSLVFGPDGAAMPKPVSATIYEELDAEFGGFAGHMLVAEHAFDTPWSTWEMHPKGDEFVYLLEGDVDFILWTGSIEKSVRVNQPGTYVVVPKGTWHTARPRQPTRMLFLTPGEGTRNAESPGS